MQIENALMQTAKLEAELVLLYMQTGNIDIWNKIKARAAEMDRDDAIEARKAKDEEKKRKGKAFCSHFGSQSSSITCRSTSAALHTNLPYLVF